MMLKWVGSTPINPAIVKSAECGVAYFSATAAVPDTWAVNMNHRISNGCAQTVTKIRPLLK